MADVAAAEFVEQALSGCDVAGGRTGRLGRRLVCSILPERGEVGQERQDLFVGQGRLGNRVHGGAEPAVPDHVEALLIGGEREP